MRFLNLLEIERATLNEEEVVLLESIRREVSNDVDHIYTKFFRDDIRDINQNDGMGLMIHREIIPHTRVEREGVFKTNYMKRIHSLNPVSVIINEGSNYYNTVTRTISFSINSQALDAIKNNYGLTAFIRKAPQFATQIRRDLSPNRIKESIYHELAHYIDDTLNGRHLTNMTNKMVDAGSFEERAKIKNRGQSHTYLTDYEIEAMTHNVYQLFRYYHKRWDKITFEEMIKLSVSLNTLYNEFSATDPKMLEDFKRKLKSRMHREGLLGARMR